MLVLPKIQEDLLNLVKVKEAMNNLTKTRILKPALKVAG